MKFEEPSINEIDSATTKIIDISIELEQVNKKLIESEKARIRILENISHDLRAPTAAIRGAVDRLLYGSPKEEEKLYLLQTIDSRMKSLEELIGELYFSQKLNQPEFKMDKQEVDLGLLIEEYIIQLQVSDILGGRKCELKTMIQGSVKISLDIELFLRVLDNLIRNAIEHTTEQNRINIIIDEGENENEIKLIVEDTGEGVRIEDLPFIFDRTFTTVKARTPEKTGSGLGLHIAKTIIEKHKGNIHCESIFGEYTKFIICLKLEERG